MKNTGNIFLGLAAAGMLFATSFKPETGRKDVVYVPLIIDEIVDHTMVVDSTQSQSISIPEGYPIDPIFLKKSIIKSSQFGKRFHPIFRKWKMHAGIDMGAKKGTPIKTTADGRVVRIQRSRKGYGLNVIIQHTDKRYSTLYAHMSEIGVETNQQVKAGTVIGLVGSTGASTGPHLHYEIMIREEGDAKFKKVNPLPFILGRK